jgi:hypothetical protein
LRLAVAAWVRLLHVNTALARYTLAALSTAVLTALPLTALAAFSLEDTAIIQAALAGKAVVEDALVPNGFAKVAEAKGDLNGDGTDDLALIVRRAATRAKPPSVESDGVPQAVLIFTGDKTGKYILWKVGASHFMDGTENLMEEGGVGIFQIKKGVLTMASDVSMSMGGWGAGGCTLKWRNGPAGFQLIGLKVSDIDRKCACGTTNDTNYLTGLTIYTSDRDEAGDPPPKRKVKRTRAKLRTVLWEGFDFDKMCSF